MPSVKPLDENNNTCTYKSGITPPIPAPRLSLKWTTVVLADKSTSIKDTETLTATNNPMSADTDVTSNSNQSTTLPTSSETIIPRSPAELTNDKHSPSTPQLPSKKKSSIKANIFTHHTKVDKVSKV